MNMFDDNSSNSQDSNADDFGGLLKKVQGQFQDSDQNQSSSYHLNDKEKRKNYSKRISSLLNMDDKDGDKTKLIKKNCISAKKSRQRKKLYIQVLEKKAESLKEQINKRKSKILQNRGAIMNILGSTNPEKSKFIEQNLQLSKKLAKQASKPESEQQQNNQNQEKLQMMINSYLYKFGFNGVLRKDVIEQIKAKWYETAIDQKLIMAGKEQELKKILSDFKECMTTLEDKNGELQFLVRQLQQKLSREQIIKFLIDPKFFVAKEASKQSEFKIEQLKQSEQVDEE